MNDHHELPYCEQVNWEEALCMSWSESCVWAMALYAACQWQMMVQYCCGSGSTNKLFCMCFLVWQEAIEVTLNVSCTRWPWKALDYSSRIILYPLQVECHIMSRTKQQRDIVVNSWQSKSRYKCGSCNACQESTNGCQTTQFNVACPSNIGDMCIHSKMTV